MLLSMNKRDVVFAILDPILDSLEKEKEEMEQDYLDESDWLHDQERDSQLTS